MTDWRSVHKELSQINVMAPQLARLERRYLRRSGPSRPLVVYRGGAAAKAAAPTLAARSSGVVAAHLFPALRSGSARLVLGGGLFGVEVERLKAGEDMVLVRLR